MQPMMRKSTLCTLLLLTQSSTAISDQQQRQRRAGIAQKAENECLYCNLFRVDLQVEHGNALPTADLYRCVTYGHEESDGREDMVYTIDLPHHFKHEHRHELQAMDSFDSTEICIEGGEAIRDVEHDAEIQIPHGANIYFVNTRRRDLQNVVDTTNIKRSTLLVRVIGNGGNEQTNHSKSELEEFAFGEDGPSFQSQYKDCSYGSLEFEPVQNSLVNKGVLELPMDMELSGRSIFALENDLVEAVEDVLGIASLQAEYDHILFCMPRGTRYSDQEESTGWLAFAYPRSWRSYYNDPWCSSLSALVHEVAHNLNLYHAGLTGSEQDPDVAYGDTSGYMGYSYSQINGPLMCFNGFHSHQFGWYQDAYLELDTQDDLPWKGRLVAVTNFQEAVGNDQSVLIRVMNYYVLFNRVTGINNGSRLAKDEVTITLGTSFTKDSIHQGGITAGESMTLDDVVFEVCAVEMDNASLEYEYAVFSIHKDGTSSQCSPYDVSVLQTPSTFAFNSDNLQATNANDDCKDAQGKVLFERKEKECSKWESKCDKHDEIRQACPETCDACPGGCGNFQDKGGRVRIPGSRKHVRCNDVTLEQCESLLVKDEYCSRSCCQVAKERRAAAPQP